jgi:hypothetical protein
MDLFTNSDEAKQAIVIGAAVALHALIAGRVDPLQTPDQIEQYVRAAFDVSREFFKRAKQEIGT